MRGTSVENYPWIQRNSGWFRLDGADDFHWPPAGHGLPFGLGLVVWKEGGTRGARFGMLGPLHTFGEIAASPDIIRLSTSGTGIITTLEKPTGVLLRIVSRRTALKAFDERRVST